jgi:hypothetical protein
LDARLTTLLCKKITVPKSKGVTNGCNLAESSKECYGSKRAVLPMMMMMMTTMNNSSSNNVIAIFYFLIYTLYIIWRHAMV